VAGDIKSRSPRVVVVTKKAFAAVSSTQGGGVACASRASPNGVFSLFFFGSLTQKKVHIIDTSCHHECGRIIEEVRVRGRLRVREVRVHGFATVRDSSSSSSSSSLSRAFFLARTFWTTLDGGKKKKKKKKKKRSTTNFRGWVGNREEEDDDEDDDDEKENENVPLDRRARVRKRRSKVCSFWKKRKKRVPRSRHFFLVVFFRAYFFLLRKDTKKRRLCRALTSANNRTQTSLSLSLISLPADTIMRRILLPIDSTGEDVDVLKWVIENVHRAGDQIVLLHVYVCLPFFFALSDV